MIKNDVPQRRKSPAICTAVAEGGMHVTSIVKSLSAHTDTHTRAANTSCNYLYSK